MQGGQADGDGDEAEDTIPIVHSKLAMRAMAGRQSLLPAQAQVLPFLPAKSAMPTCLDARTFMYISTWQQAERSDALLASVRLISLPSWVQAKYPYGSSLLSKCEAALVTVPGSFCLILTMEVGPFLAMAS